MAAARKTMGYFVLLVGKLNLDKLKLPLCPVRLLKKEILLQILKQRLLSL